MTKTSDITSKEINPGNTVYVMPSEFNWDGYKGFARVLSVDGDDITVELEGSLKEVSFHSQRIASQWR